MIPAGAYLSLFARTPSGLVKPRKCIQFEGLQPQDDLWYLVTLVTTVAKGQIQGYVTSLTLTYPHDPKPVFRVLGHSPEERDGIKKFLGWPHAVFEAHESNVLCGRFGMDEDVSSVVSEWASQIRK